MNFSFEKNTLQTIVYSACGSGEIFFIKENLQTTNDMKIVTFCFQKSDWSGLR